MKHLVTLRKVDGTTVIAFVEARTEEEAKAKALNTANMIAKDNKSRVLMSEKPLKVGSVEVWKNASNRIVMGLKKYEALVVSQYGLEENRMVGFKGEKSVYNSIIKTLMPREELRVFIRDLDQIPVEVKKPVAKPVRKVTLKDAYRVIENKGWSIYEDKNDDEIGLELSQYSGAGEDFNFSINFDGTISDLQDKISDYVYNFDTDEHIKLHLGAEGGSSGLPSIRRLVKDAEDLQKSLEDLSNKIKEKSRKNPTLENAYKVIEDEGWSVDVMSENDDEVELELSQYTGAGEDFNFTVYFDGTVNDLQDKIYDYAFNFDVDEHIEMLLGADGNDTSGLPSIRRLVEDADDIYEMLKELEIAVNQVKEN